MKALKALKDEFMKPFFKTEMVSVILNAVISLFLLGLLVGLLEFFFVKYINSAISIFIVFVGVFIGSRIKNAYTQYHIFYSLISGLATLVCDFLSRVVFVLFMNGSFLDLLYQTIRQFLVWEWFYIDANTLLSNVIKLVLLPVAIIVSWKFAKSNQEDS